MGVEIGGEEVGSEVRMFIFLMYSRCNHTAPWQKAIKVKWNFQADLSNFFRFCQMICIVNEKRAEKYIGKDQMIGLTSRGGILENFM